MVWDANPEIFSITLGSLHLAPRWYGLLFATGLLAGYYIMGRYYKEAGLSEDKLSAAFLYFVVGTIVGARLGHVLFYDFNYYLNHPVEIIKIWQGGLASHGGVIGILVAIVLYCRKYKISMVWFLDRAAIASSLGVPFIRLGNFMNSEIVGKPTDLPWGIVFKLYDEQHNHPLVARHPAQLYEAIAYFMCFLFLYHLKKRKPDLADGKIFGLMLIWIFSARFFIEFFKENQEAFEQGMVLNMGQILSIPLIILGWAFFKGWYKSFFPASFNVTQNEKDSTKKASIEQKKGKKKGKKKAQKKRLS